ncbi:hypothetical protein [Pseudomonas sp. B22129]|uniref:hypothetical protein n=1 Tax=Pseudomonas sp. B22129 TaxID=3235111 RepID=UPI00378518B6
MAYSTGNPVEPSGSTDPRDLRDNAQILDQLVNGSALTWPGRLGKALKTWTGMQFEFSNQLQNIGWEAIYVQYAAGGVVERANQLVQYPANTGDLYKVKNPSSLPLTLTGTWATDAPKLVSVGDASVRQYVQPFLNAGFFQPTDLDLTGTTDQSAKIVGYLNQYKRVRLPAGIIKALEIIVPTGCTLVGAGSTLMNRTTKQWSSGGTTVVGTIGFTGSNSCVLGNMNIDAFATGNNALFGVSETTRDIYVKSVNTRANNHNHLWEQNGSDPAGRYGGNILVEDCIAYGGPNGFVTKMNSVTFRRCLAYDTTVQAFVVVSDNINGAGVYSRATKTKIQQCGGDGNHQGVTVYSRDAFSENNANGVAGTQDTEIDVSFTGIGNCSVHVGFYKDGTAGFTPLYNDNVTITGGNYSAPTPGFHIRLDNAARPRINAGYFVGASAIVLGDFCVDPVVSPAVSTYGPMTGILASEIVYSSNDSAVNVDIARKRVVFRNTFNVTVNSIVTSNPQKELDIFIDDPYTTVAIGGVLLAGKGASARVSYDESVAAFQGWKVVSSGSTLPRGEVLTAYDFDKNFSWQSMAVRIPLSGNINSMSLHGDMLAAGDRVSMRIYNTETGPRSIFNWNYVLFGAIPVVTTIPNGKTALIQMQWDGSNHIVTSVNTY